MTIKTRSIYVRSPQRVTWTSNVGAANPYTRTAGTLSVLSRWRSGIPNPNWRQQVKDCVDATTVLSANGQFRSFRSGMAYASQADGQNDPILHPHLPLIETYEGCSLVGTSQPGIPSMSDTTARNLALSRLYKAIRSQTTHFTGGTFLGEFKESLKTIKNVTKKIANRIPSHLAAQQKLTKRWMGSYVIGANGSAVRVKDFNPRKGKRLSPPDWAEFRKGLADNWLEFAFGIRPLVKDVHDAAEALARYQHDSVHERVRAYGNSVTTISDTTTNNNFALTLLTGSYRVRNWAEVVVVFRAGLLFSLSSPAFGTADRLRGLLGFKLEDFVPTMWNLLPYSFFVDYLVNVGDILNAITTDTSSVRYVDEVVVRMNNQDVTTKAHQTFGTGVDVSGDYGSVSSQTRTVDRQPSSLQIPIPEFEIPGLLTRDGAFNQQLVNMLALLTGGSGARRGF